MAFTAFLFLWIIAIAIWSIGFMFAIAAARRRNPGVSFLLALWHSGRRGSIDLYTPDGLRFNNLARRCALALCLIVPLLLGAIAAAKLRGELPGPQSKLTHGHR
jgi:hypothetical protein